MDERQADFDQKLTGIDQKLTGLDRKIDDLGLDTRAGFKRLERRIATLSFDISAVRTDQSDLERRMDRLEDKMNVKPEPSNTGSR